MSSPEQPYSQEDAAASVSETALRLSQQAMRNSLAHGASSQWLLKYYSENPQIAQSPAEEKTSNEIERLKKVISGLARKVEHQSQQGQQLETQKRALKSKVTQLQKLESFSYLLSAVTKRAHTHLKKDKQFRENFTSQDAKKCFVVSVDIRRSTELMLKAKTPIDFANFISGLCDLLSSIFKENFGVVDKFTGDGILAFFPEFYSGQDAGYLALASCKEAQAVFREYYESQRRAFSSILLDVGLGCGIDYGEVNLMQIGGNLTVVGKPVVYACRIGSAPAGRTYLNQPAQEIISDKYHQYFEFIESELQIKHEGTLLCYDTFFSNSRYTPKDPMWAR